MNKNSNASRKRVTSYDVARLAGVSQSAVSRAFRPGLSVSTKTKDKVMKAAKKLGYKPNAIARMLITQRSGMVAVIISRSSAEVYPELLSKITDQLSNRGVRVLLFSLDDKDDLVELLDQVWTFQVDGVIALTAHFAPDDIAQFEDHNIPVVLYNRQVTDHPVNTVSVDHDQGIRQLVDLLIAGGSKNFLLMSGPTESDVGNERRKLALHHLARHGIEDVPVCYGDFSYQSGKDCFRQWMEKNPAPDAVICSNDTMAIGCIDSARDEFGLNLPGELSVCGFDGIHAAFWTGYDLTTIRQPVNQMAKAAADILMERIENPETLPEKRVLAGTLIKGSSVQS